MCTVKNLDNLVLWCMILIKFWCNCVFEVIQTSFLVIDSVFWLSWSGRFSIFPEKWRQIPIWSFFPFVVMSANHPNFQEQLTRKEHTDYPYIYRPSLCLRRETCRLLVSFSYHLSSLAFAFCLALQFQWHKCPFQRASSLSLAYWKNYDSKQLKTIFPIVFPTIVQLLHLTLG